jgi:hypothetical protein
VARFGAAAADGRADHGTSGRGRRRALRRRVRCAV